jgi:hypothetical protein
MNGKAQNSDLFLEEFNRAINLINIDEINQDIKALDLEETNMQYKKFTGVANFNFNSLEITNEKPINNAKIKYKLFYDQDKKIKKISQLDILTNKNVLDYFLFYDSNFIIGVPFLYNNSKSLEKNKPLGYLIDAIIIFDTIHSKTTLITINNLFSLIRVEIEIEKLEYYNYELVSTISINDVQRIFQLNENMEPVTRLNVEDTSILSFSEVKNVNNEVFEIIYVFNTKNNIGIDKMNNQLLSRFLYSGFDFQFSIKATVKPEIQEDFPLWVYPSILYK